MSGESSRVQEAIAALAGGSEELFRAIFQLSQDAIGVSRDGVHIMTNDAYLRLFGYGTHSELLGRPILDLIAPQDRPWVLAQVRKRSAGEPTENAYEIKGYRKDGTAFDMDVHVSGYRVRDATFTLVVLRDITEQKQARAAAEERSAFYQAIFDNYPLPKFVVDTTTGKIRQANQAAADFYGFTLEELTDRPLGSINVSPREEIQDAMRKAIRRERNVFRFKHRLASGEIRDVEVYSSPMQWQSGTLLLSSILDVTDRIALEEQLRQSQRMEAVGQLSGAIAHDFNNLLTTVMGFASLAMEEMPPDSPARRHTDQVIRTSVRAADLTRQLLAFSRRQVLQPQVLNLNALLLEMDVLLRHAVGERVSVHWELADNAGNVRADPTQLQQVVMNLAVNARDAMPRGGTLTICTRRVERCTLLDPVQDAVLLEVEDTGEGMDEAVRTRVFEPFFTTKGKDRGTGLGLSTVYGIVKQSGGGIGVESTVGVGTHFKVALPRTETAVPAHESTEKGPGVMLNGRRVLVVEDQLPVRNLLVRGLGMRGCTVLEAGDGVGALEVLAREKVDVVVTDVVMPGMSGVELVGRIRCLHPGLPVVMMSGDPAGLLVKSGDTAGTEFLAKPFTVEQLGAALAKVLSA